MKKRWLVKWMKKSYWCHICKNSGGIRINIFLLRPATLIPATRLSYQNCGLRSWHGAGEYPWEATYITESAVPWSCHFSHHSATNEILNCKTRSFSLRAERTGELWIPTTWKRHILLSVNLIINLSFGTLLFISLSLDFSHFLKKTIMTIVTQL